MRLGVAATVMLTAVLYGQSPIEEAKRLMRQSPPDRNGAETVLRSAVRLNPNDVEALQLFSLLLAPKAVANPAAAQEGHDHAVRFLRALEARPETHWSELALALELTAHFQRVLQKQAEMEFNTARALEIRRRLVREAQPPIDVRCQRTGGDRTPPKLKQKTEPEYSEEAKWAGHQGTVVLVLAVDVDGRAKDVRLIRSLGFGLDENALAAVQTWSFEPGQQNGLPVAICAQVEMNFRLL